MIDISGVTKRFAGKVALDHVDLALAAKGRLALIGTSGCGKSTLLRLVIGLLTPDEGTVRVLDEVVSRESAPMLRRRIGYVIQDGGLFPHLSARDNAALMARHVGWDEAKIDARITELAALARLDEGLLARFPAELSGGQRQRVGIVRALMLDPVLLLLDEPLGALDPIVRSELQDDLVKVVHELDKTLLVVTHDLAEAAFFAEEVALMRGGVVVQRGPLKELVDHPKDEFVASFLRAQRTPWWGAS